MGIPVQFSAGCILHASSRSRVLRLIRQGICCVTASDCHDTDHRRPNLGPAWNLLERKLPVQCKTDMELRAAEILCGAAPLM